MLNIMIFFPYIKSLDANSTGEMQKNQVTYKPGTDINSSFFGRNIPKTMSKGEEENRNLSALRYLPVGCSTSLVKMIDHQKYIENSKNVHIFINF